MSLIIREAEPSDTNVVLDYVKKLVQELDGDSDHIVLREEEISKWLEEKSYIVLIAENKDHPVGVLTMAQTKAVYANGNFGVIQELFVEKTFRSAGIGKLLIDKAKEMSNNNGWTRIEVGAPDRNQFRQTLSFYKREGFVEIGPRLKLFL